MANKPMDGPVYLKFKGWFWVEWIGQRSIYHGPYRSEAEAKAKHSKVKV